METVLGVVVFTALILTSMAAVCAVFHRPGVRRGTAFRMEL